MKKIYLIGVFAFLSLFQSVYANEFITRYYVKIIVKGVDTSVDAKNIDQFITAKNGVLSSRMDYRTNIYFGLYNSSSGIKIDDYNNWITSLGYEVKCFHYDIHGENYVIQFTENDCNNEVLIKTK